MPNSKLEAVLENILGAQNELTAPESRADAILQAILYGDSYSEEARCRFETILLAILNQTECEITEPRCEEEEILLNILNKSLYDEEVHSRMSELLVLWSKQEADPERFKFPFKLPEAGKEMSVEQEEEQ